MRGRREIATSTRQCVLRILDCQASIGLGNPPDVETSESTFVKASERTLSAKTSRWNNKQLRACNDRRYAKIVVEPSNGFGLESLTRIAGEHKNGYLV